MKYYELESRCHNARRYDKDCEFTSESQMEKEKELTSPSLCPHCYRKCEEKICNEAKSAEEKKSNLDAFRAKQGVWGDG